MIQSAAPVHHPKCRMWATNTNSRNHNLRMGWRRRRCSRKMKALASKVKVSAQAKKTSQKSSPLTTMSAYLTNTTWKTGSCPAQPRSSTATKADWCTGEASKSKDDWSTHRKEVRQTTGNIFFSCLLRHISVGGGRPSRWSRSNLSKIGAIIRRWVMWCRRIRLAISKQRGVTFRKYWRLEACPIILRWLVSAMAYSREINYDSPTWLSVRKL